MLLYFFPRRLARGLYGLRLDLAMIPLKIGVVDGFGVSGMVVLPRSFLCFFPSRSLTGNSIPFSCIIILKLFQNLVPVVQLALDLGLLPRPLITARAAGAPPRVRLRQSHAN